MKRFIKWKIFLITSFVCILPVIFGIFSWNNLPDSMAIHFDINNNPDNFASKTFVVFGLPLLMVILQWICCVINDVNAYKFGDRKKFEYATKWIIPVMSFILYIITIGYSLGWKIDIRAAVCLIIGAMLLVIGNYLPKFDRLNGIKADAEKSRLINRFIGYETVVMGILFLISIFLPPIATVFCVLLFIPYTIIAIMYAFKVIRKKY